MSLGKVVRGSLWLYIAGIASNLLGYIYWLVATRFVDASVIGSAAAVVGTASIIGGLFSLGLSSGATRMIGMAAGREDRVGISAYFLASFIISLAIYGLVSVLLFLLPPSLIRLTREELRFVAVLILIGSGSWGGILSVLFTSTLRTEVNALASITSNLLRICLGTLLLYLNMGVTGVIGGYIIAALTLEAIYLIKCGGLVSTRRPTLYHVKELLKAGMPSYVPSLLSIAGTWLGVIGIYGLTGSEQAGTYYISYSVASLVYSLPTTLLGLMFPVLSGMEDGRKRATNRAVRLTYALIAPIAALGMAYPWVPLGLLGVEYIEGSFVLQILLIGTLVAPLNSGFSSLIYAYGRYRAVTIIGILSNLPRVLLYLPLVAVWGDLGAALSYVSGYFFAFVWILIISPRHGYKIEGRNIMPLFAIPLALAFLSSSLKLHWIFGTVFVLGSSILAYTRLSLIKKDDLREVSEGILSKRRIETVYPHAKYIMYILYGKEE